MTASPEHDRKTYETYETYETWYPVASRIDLLLPHGGPPVLPRSPDETAAAARLCLATLDRLLKLDFDGPELDIEQTIAVLEAACLLDDEARRLRDEEWPENWYTLIKSAIEIAEPRRVPPSLRDRKAPAWARQTS